MSTFVQYIAPGDQRLFSVPFPYLSTSHVQVELNGVLQVHGADYEWVGNNAIEFRPTYTPVAGSVVRIRRVTPIEDLLVVFQNGAVLTEGDLNTATRQLFYLTQEVRDVLDGHLRYGLARLTDGTAVSAQEMIDAITQEILTSDLLAELNTRIVDIDTNAESILQQVARLDQIQNVIDTLLEIDGVGIATYVQNETQARIDGDTALAATIALLGAEAHGGSSFVLNLDTVMASPTESLAQKFSWLESNVSDNTAAIAQEVTARTNAVSALASVVTTLESSVGANEASIQSILSTVDGLNSTWMIKTNVNGHIAGVGLYNSGVESDFIVQANRFAIVDPSNPSNVKVPFVVSGGTVYMQNVVIGSALIDNLTITKLTHGNLNADMNVGTGRIIWTNGIYMKVTGVGFGSNNQFIEWFGPHFSNFNNCTEANAIQYLKTNGDAYFGGSLLAGTLTNQGTTSDITPTAFIDIGPFNTNGNQKKVTVSYNIQYTAQTGSSTNPGNPTATVTLYRSVGGGAWVPVTTLNVTGSRQTVDNTAPGVWEHFMAASGSTTITDNTAGTQDFMYRAALTARNTPGISFGISQRVSVISIEE